MTEIKNEQNVQISTPDLSSVNLSTNTSEIQTQSECNIQTENNIPVEENKNNCNKKKKIATIGKRGIISGLTFFFLGFMFGYLLIRFGLLLMIIGFILRLIGGRNKNLDENKIQNEEKRKINPFGIIFSIIGVLLFIFGFFSIRVGGPSLAGMIIGPFYLTIGLLLRHKTKKNRIYILIYGILFILLILYSLIVNRSINSKCFNYGNWVINGKKIVFYKDQPGQILFEGNCKNGWEDGKWTEYRRNGQIDTERFYKNRKNDGKRTSYYRNGQIKYEMNYRDGISIGKRIRYYDNGQIEQERYYNNDGELNGKWIRYYKNGQIKEEMYYDNGVKIGKRVEYNEDGSIKSIEEY